MYCGLLGSNDVVPLGLCSEQEGVKGENESEQPAGYDRVGSTNLESAALVSLLGQRVAGLLVVLVGLAGLRHQRSDVVSACPECRSAG